MKLLNKLHAFTKNKLKFKFNFKFKLKKEAPAPRRPLLSNIFQNEKILNHLKTERATISIKFEQTAEPYVSMLLDIDPNKQFIIIDEINSPLGHRLACSGDPFVITAKDNGILIFFHSRVLDYGTIEGISFYRLAYPTHIEHLQRRATTRLKVPNDVSMSADFLMPRMGVVRAKIADISLGGIQLIFPKNVKRIFEHYHHIDHCRIISPFLASAEFSLDIKHCAYDLSTQKTILGCQFANLDNKGLKFLSTLTGHLQLPAAFR